MILILVALWCLRLVEIRIAQRHKKPGRIPEKSRFTLRLMMLGGFSINIAVILELLFVPRPVNVIVTACGAGSLLLRVALKYWCVKTLREFWSADIEIREDHELVREGPYRHLRHPAYLANIIEAVAYPLLANAYFSLLVFAFAFVPTVIVRIHFEEKELAAKFGSSYEDYRTRSWALVPFRSFLLDLMGSRL